ncbi:MAG TPA: hypothetical protein VMS98_00200 [Thermoanaerobaculia bacterium]|nr:hypothetical protein [Thermoanaerobaculia bacterium]
MTATAPAALVLVRCPCCRQQIDAAAIQTSRHAVCPACLGEFNAVRFDPPARVAALPRLVTGTLDAGQPCASHARNAAVTSCQRCGSFMCALCRIDVDGRTLCPTCFDRLSTEGSLHSTRTTFRDYSGLASVSATAGCLLVVVLGLLFGPLTIYYAVKAFKLKKEMGEEDGKGFLWVAITFGVIETVVGIFFLGALVMGMLE